MEILSLLMQFLLDFDKILIHEDKNRFMQIKKSKLDKHSTFKPEIQSKNVVESSFPDQGLLFSGIIVIIFFLPLSMIQMT